jgi:hypothetical protein
LLVRHHTILIFPRHRDHTSYWLILRAHYALHRLRRLFGEKIKAIPAFLHLHKLPMTMNLSTMLRNLALMSKFLASRFLCCGAGSVGRRAGPLIVGFGGFSCAHRLHWPISNYSSFEPLSLASPSPLRIQSIPRHNAAAECPDALEHYLIGRGIRSHGHGLR